MVDATPRKRRSHVERLDDANAQAGRAAKRLARKLHQVEVYERAADLRERNTANDKRRSDTRRKIIAGALALEEKDRGFRGKLMALIDEYVTADRDRELFGLEPLPVDASLAPRAA